MNTKLKLGLASAIAVAACIILPTTSPAADLYGGSLKDGYAPAYSAPAIAGPCYLRGDVGYAWASSPKGYYVGNGVDPHVRGASVDNGGSYDVGIGCGSGSRGLRGEIAVGFIPRRDFTGDVDIVINNQPVDPPIKATIDSYTVMVNGYYDFGNFRGFVPYVGAGVGIAMHDMGYVTIDHPASPNPQHGDSKIGPAWSLMAGVGYQMSSNAILDVGYRYINMGLAQSNQGDTAQFLNPKLVVDDLSAHELRIGLRYHFGSSSSCCGYAPLK
ncbi:MAG: outer membrane beta-barrel protein [Hyphomicrobiaceae bacterium]